MSVVGGRDAAFARGHSHLAARKVGLNKPTNSQKTTRLQGGALHPHPAVSSRARGCDNARSSQRPAAWVWAPAPRGGAPARAARERRSELYTHGDDAVAHAEPGQLAGLRPRRCHHVMDRSARASGPGARPLTCCAGRHLRRHRRPPLLLDHCGDRLHGRAPLFEAHLQRRRCDTAGKGEQGVAQLHGGRGRGPRREPRGMPQPRGTAAACAAVGAPGPPGNSGSGAVRKRQ